MTNKVTDSELLVSSSVKEYSKELRDLKLRIVADRSPNFDPKRLFPLLIRR